MTTTRRRRLEEAKCPDKLSNVSVFSASQAPQCRSDSTYSFFVIAGPPTHEQIEKICDSKACATTIAAIKKAVQSDCTVAPSVRLYRDILDPIDSKCSWASSAGDRDVDETINSSPTDEFLGNVTKQANDLLDKVKSVRLEDPVVYTKEKSSSSGIIIGALLGAALTAAVMFFVLRRRRSSNPEAANDTCTPCGAQANYSAPRETKTTSSQSGTATSTAVSSSQDSLMRDGASGLWDDEAITAARIPLEKVCMGTLVNRGAFGEVYRGSYKGQTVAIKRLVPERRKNLKQIDSFLAEVKLMASMEHERIVRFIGVAWDSLTDLCVVTEYMSGGDLRALLAGFDEEARAHGFDTMKVKIALHVAHALTYMHSLSPVVLHRDLKSKNILLDCSLNAKLTDFGVSRERADSTMTAGVGSSLWMAPEVMIGERYDEKADVFSFGVVLSELDTHKLPYSHAKEPGTGRKIPDTAVLQMVSLGRLTVQFTDQADPEMVQLGRDCVELDPMKRPTAPEVLHRVHQLWRGYGTVV
ncbi:hypothetical protein P43SY_007321 [Pythium insidiosum]|uniref:Protein kinase domain-containing protein n=1 Tax=Pythium insidiosum TaxID=114742 RepID=A0AAD5Q244_PYTIN|nr:hypothetical protein P43SY_007321 [Pythium insidiosum]